MNQPEALGRLDDYRWCPRCWWRCARCGSIQPVELPRRSSPDTTHCRGKCRPCPLLRKFLWLRLWCWGKILRRSAGVARKRRWEDGEGNESSVFWWFHASGCWSGLNLGGCCRRTFQRVVLLRSGTWSRWSPVVQLSVSPVSKTRSTTIRRRCAWLLKRLASLGKLKGIKNTLK